VAVNREKYSFPVVKVDFINMHPLDFEEFLTDPGQERLVNAVKDCYYSNSAIHNLA